MIDRPQLLTDLQRLLPTLEQDILDYNKRIDPESGALVHDFTDADWDTRFLGDLYQDLSEAVRKRYALLQTPEFVESFILDYTLTPALDAFGLHQVGLIDPTCGSGHFLLGAFGRLFEAWQKREPATNARELAQRALGAVYGVDINPYITVKDKALNQAYRDRYPTCQRQYSLGVPFTERFFDLSVPAQDNRPAGFVGMITANSFMKREFGRKLIEAYLPRKDLTHVIGERLRDWGNDWDTWVWYPYCAGVEASEMLKDLWRWRSTLANRKTFQGVMADAGLHWYEYMQHTPSAYATPLSIPFAFVATHNHFVLDRGGKVCNRSAPVIKFPQYAGEAEHLALLGLLNSSTACFWMKQMFYPKGGDHVGIEGARVRKTLWDERYEHTGTGLKDFPIPTPEHPRTLHYAQTLDTLAQKLAAQSPTAILTAWTPARPLADTLAEAEGRDNTLWHQMIARQEELDWHCYRLYGLTDQDLCHPDTPPGIRLGQRPFEIRIARHMAAGEAETTWFQRHGSTPVTEIPADWPADYRVLTERRLAAMEANRWIALVEQPEYKRRWNREPWEKRQQRALQQWLLDCLESRCHDPELITCAQLTDRVRHDPGFQQVAALYTGNPDFDPQSLVCELVAQDQVPQMAACRCRPKALPKFRAWQET
jgi:hypothetical protein